MENKYQNSIHTWGRIWMVTALVIIISVPLFFCIINDSWPALNHVIKGFLGVAPIFWTTCTIEVITYAPMLGSAGTYLGFVSGNLTNLKVPCALNAMDAAEVEPGSDEGEVISTIAIASSSIITTLIIAVGVFMLIPLTPILESPALKPAFDNILPALFGGLGVVFISKNFKISIAPMLSMILLFIFVPSLSKAVGVLVPLAALISIVVARILYKKNRI